MAEPIDYRTILLDWCLEQLTESDIVQIAREAEEFDPGLLRLYPEKERILPKLMRAYTQRTLAVDLGVFDIDQLDSYLYKQPVTSESMAAQLFVLMLIVETATTQDVIHGEKIANAIHEWILHAQTKNDLSPLLWGIVGYLGSLMDHADPSTRCLIAAAMTALCLGMLHRACHLDPEWRIAFVQFSDIGGRMQKWLQLMCQNLDEIHAMLTSSRSKE